MAVNHQLRQNVQFQLSRSSKRRLTKLGLGPSPGCDQEIEKMLFVGVTRLANNGALEKPEQLTVAEESLNKILNDLNERAQTLGTYPVIDEIAFNQMRSRLSPMWPFL